MPRKGWQEVDVPSGSRSCVVVARSRHQGMSVSRTQSGSRIIKAGGARVLQLVRHVSLGQILTSLSGCLREDVDSLPWAEGPESTVFQETRVKVQLQECELFLDRGRRRITTVEGRIVEVNELEKSQLRLERLRLLQTEASYPQPCQKCGGQILKEQMVGEPIAGRLRSSRSTVPVTVGFWQF